VHKEREQVAFVESISEIISIVVSIDSCFFFMTYLIGIWQDSFEKRVGLSNSIIGKM